MFRQSGVFMLKVNAGDVIRSYDFKPMVGREDCFVEGIVEDNETKEMGYKAYKITVTKDSWSDAEDKGRVGKTVYVPIKVLYNDYPGRVINLSRI
jgi:hypothetical protein